MNTNSTIQQMPTWPTHFGLEAVTKTRMIAKLSTSGGVFQREGVGQRAGAQPIKTPEISEAGYAARLFPNPANSWALLETNAAEDFEAFVQIFDVTGKLVSSFSQTCFANEPSLLDLSSLHSGYYTVKIFREGKPVFTDKLVITRGVVA